ncbi:hypothetical protein KYC5002_28285 [Archangium violaceum]|uniref:hypothetical protein n=1 Tax=Archangium violaceum TaxID=83451 RepID=UPI002B325C21|nr:hypothetical protein KYC5002_28285 [Archangium gephyra]
MKWLRQHVGGILFDGACLVLGYAATFLAFWAWYEGTLEQFWSFRLVLSTPLALLIALASTLLRHDAAWRCWLRFALFECLMLQLFVDSVLRDWRWSNANYREHSMQFLLTLLLNAVVYAVGLNVWRLRRHGARPA